ncbi:MAG: protein-disulfide reductase DsbD N-terminal domain-containing protein [Bryobacteraceae bacterium]|nr:protein-disulfide reductase DsbD N-terminal domain-containing protein [Bryobacteraceae bacterium]
MKKKSASCWISLLSALLAAPAAAQSQQILTLQEPQKVVVPRQEEVRIPLKATIRPGYHANSDKPSEDYLIPLRLTWDAQGPLQPVEIIYPKPKFEKFAFTEKPIAVIDGDFEIVTRFRRPPNAMPGPALLAGKLRYQACNDRMCFPPKTVEVKVPLILQ